MKGRKKKDRKKGGATKAHERLIVRSGLVQLETHPAISISGHNLMCEPFLPKASESEVPFLSLLRQHGYPVQTAQEYCRERYCHWMYDRVKGILLDLELRARSDSEEIPDILVFPEGSIPADIVSVDGRESSCLELLAEFSDKWACTVFAGTHALAEDISYRDALLLPGIGVGSDELDSILDDARKLRVDNPTVLPVFRPFLGPILLTKRTQAPFEVDDQGAEVSTRSKATVKPITIELRSRTPGSGDMREKRNDRITVEVLPCVCSDSLRLPPTEDERITVICAYERNPKRYESEIGTRVSNQQLVLLCNDGAYGGSGAFFARDQRSSSWWFSSPNGGGLPKGDALLIIDVAVKQLHASVGVHNPQTNYSLRRIGAIVSDTTVNSGSRIARSFERVAGILKGGFVDQKSVAAALADLIARERPSGIQEAKLHRTLALAEQGNLSRRRAAMLCRDVSLSTPDLKAKRHEFLRHCLALANQIISETGRDGQDYHALKSFRDVCSRRLGDSAAISLVPYVWSYLRSQAAQVRGHVGRKLEHQVAATTEVFNATSAWLYSKHRTREPTGSGESAWQLLPRVTHNAVPRESPFLPTDHSAMVWVAGSNSSFLTSKTYEKDIALPFYVRLNRRTNSELAVPVRGVHRNARDGTRKAEVLGVLNLEANVTSAFNAAQALELAVLSSQIAPELLLMKLLDARTHADTVDGGGAAHLDHQGIVASEIFAWHPDIHGWGLRKLLNNLAHTLSGAIPVGAGRPLVACTIWNVDPDKGKLLARGCSGFGYEYEAKMTVPLEGTFLGGAATQDLGVVERGAIEDFMIWRRRAKAERMELMHLVATPFVWPSGSTRGLLSFFFFRVQGHKMRDYDVEQVFDDHTVRSLAELVGRLSSSVRSLQENFGKALVRAEMPAPWSHSESVFHRALRVIMECLECDAGTIFIVEGESDSIHYVASTGAFSRRGSDTGASSVDDPAGLGYSRRRGYARCTDSSPEQPIIGITQWLAENPGCCVRKTVVLDQAEAVRVSSLGGENLYFCPSGEVVEFRPLGEVSRFLGCSEEVPSSRARIVVRLIRNESARPFVLADEGMLQALVREFIESSPGVLSSRAAGVPDGKLARFAAQDGINMSWTKWSVAQLLRDVEDVAGSRLPDRTSLLSIMFVIESEGGEFQEYHVNNSREVRDSLKRIGEELTDDLGQPGLVLVESGSLAEALQLVDPSYLSIGRGAADVKLRGLASKILGGKRIGLTVHPFRWYGLGRYKRAGLVGVFDTACISDPLDAVRDVFHSAARKLIGAAGVASLRAREGALDPLYVNPGGYCGVGRFREMIRESEMCNVVEFEQPDDGSVPILTVSELPQVNLAAIAPRAAWTSTCDEDSLAGREVAESVRRWRDLLIDNEFPGKVDFDGDPESDCLLMVEEGLYVVDSIALRLRVVGNCRQPEATRRVLSVCLAYWSAFVAICGAGDEF